MSQKVEATLQLQAGVEKVELQQIRHLVSETE
jgi:hypothetical protein